MATPTFPASGAGNGVPTLPADATPQEREAHWLAHVYQGDRVKQLTLRAVLTGAILGMLMSASNLYTLLTVGWLFGIAITASVISFVIWSTARPISLLIPSALQHLLAACGVLAAIIVPVVMWQNGSWTGERALALGGPIGLAIILAYGVLRSARDPMTILETNCMASTASSAGYGTGSSIGTMFGALLLLTAIPEGKTSNDIHTMDISPWWIVAAFTLTTGLMGVLLAVPMKRQLINYEQLPFPTGIAAAETLRSLYSGSKDAIRKARILLIGMALGGVVAVLRFGEGTFKFLDSLYKATHLMIPGQIPSQGFFTLHNKGLVGFGFDTSVLLMAAGMIVGLRVCLSMLLGSAVLYFVLTPMLVAQDFPHLDETGKAFVAGYVPSIELVGGGTLYHPYRWGLWGGTALLVLSSLTTLALQWKTIARAIMPSARAEAATEQDKLAAIEVPWTWMVIGMVPVTIAMVVVQSVGFQISWWAGLIAVAMSFVLSLVGCRATGETDTTPIGAMGKVMQLLFAVIKPGQMVPNVASAGIAANASSASADLLTDLKVGYLLGANPRRQFLAQLTGVFFGTAAIVPIWYLMVPNREVLETKYAAPSTQTWAKVAQVLTQGIESLPKSAQLAILIGAMVGVLLPCIERWLVPARHRWLMPSATGLGLAFMLPFSNALSFAIGAVIAWVWGKLSRANCDRYCVPLSSGLIAGESLVAALFAMLATASGIMAWNL